MTDVPSRWNSRASSKRGMRGLTVLAFYVLGVTAAITVWALGSSTRPSGVARVPSPEATLDAAVGLLRSGVLADAISTSTIRIAIGFSIAAIIGVSIGWLAGTFALVRALTVPTTSFIRYVPPTAFVTLLVVYFGTGEQYKHVVIIVAVLFFIIQMTLDAVEDVDVRYLEMARLSDLSRMQLLQHVIIPGTLPRVVDVLRINLSGAWTFLVAAEVVGSDGGLGHLISISQRFNRVEDLFVGVLTIGVIGIVTDTVIQWLSWWGFRWAR